jgi:hypothetical protein
MMTITPLCLLRDRPLSPDGIHRDTHQRDRPDCMSVIYT